MNAAPGEQATGYVEIPVSQALLDQIMVDADAARTLGWLVADSIDKCPYQPCRIVLLRIIPNPAKESSDAKVT